MAQDHRRCELELADSSFDPVVYIAAADPGVIYGYEDIARVFDGRFRSLFEFDIEWLVEDEGEVLMMLDRFGGREDVLTLSAIVKCAFSVFLAELRSCFVCVCWTWG